MRNTHIWIARVTILCWWTVLFLTAPNQTGSTCRTFRSQSQERSFGSLYRWVFFVRLALRGPLQVLILHGCFLVFWCASYWNWLLQVWRRLRYVFSGFGSASSRRTDSLGHLTLSRLRARTCLSPESKMTQNENIWQIPKLNVLGEIKKIFTSFNFFEKRTQIILRSNYTEIQTL